MCLLEFLIKTSSEGLGEKVFSLKSNKRRFSLSVFSRKITVRIAFFGNFEIVELEEVTTWHDFAHFFCLSVLYEILGYTLKVSIRIYT